MKLFDAIMFGLVAMICFGLWLAVLWQVIVWALGFIR
jgi:hypothetical protein